MTDVSLPGLAHQVSMRAKGQSLFRKSRLPDIGAVLLIVASLVSVYWALVGVEGALSGFDWIVLMVFGISAFVLGLAGSVMSKMRKNFPLTVITVCFPLIENGPLAKYSFDDSGLAIPWIPIIAGTVICISSGILIAMSDEQFP